VGGVRSIQGEPLVAGDACGGALVTETPLSFWGGLDPVTGEVIDRRHPWSGAVVTGRVLVLPHGRGSCSASGVFLEAAANGVAPAAVIVSRADPIVGLGAILADELLGRTIPVVLISDAARATIRAGDIVDIAPDGAVEVTPANPPQTEATPG
jgi:predicted aconitase with swiveling domain